MLLLPFAAATGKQTSAAITFWCILEPLLVNFSNNKITPKFKEEYPLFELGNRHLFLFNLEGCLGKESWEFPEAQKTLQKNTEAHKSLGDKVWRVWGKRKFPQLKIMGGNFWCLEKKIDFLCPGDIAVKIWESPEMGRLKQKINATGIWQCLVNDLCMCNLETEHYESFFSNVLGVMQAKFPK